MLSPTPPFLVSAGAYDAGGEAFGVMASIGHPVSHKCDTFAYTLQFWRLGSRKALGDLKTPKRHRSVNEHTVLFFALFLFLRLEAYFEQMRSAEPREREACRGASLGLAEAHGTMSSVGVLYCRHL